ncbi:MAG: riboflavin biosynthesis protein RibF [Propionibacteriaceae bacterium]|nr:riboflavin biosynthesis protein RibF [Propionibacteriaceae bacterium]
MSDRQLALAIGTFDGVHLGHQEVIAAARSAVGGRGHVMAVTFWPHPMTVFDPSGAPPLLQNLESREDALLDAGADEILLLHFTTQMAAMTPAAFVNQIIAPLHPSAVAVGPNFTFGARGAGNPGALRQLAGGRFDVATAPAVEFGGYTVSSTMIRAVVLAGDVSSASRLMGRDFSVRGPVVRGDRRGHQLGFPTANLTPDPAVACPSDGVYAGWLALLDQPGERMSAAISVGDNPTFGSFRRVEAHVLDQDFDIYGVPVEIGFTKRLRDMVTYSSVDELVAQLTKDVRATRALA